MKVLHHHIIKQIHRFLFIAPFLHLMTLGAQPLPTNDGEENDTTTSRFAGWTEEQIKEFEDSVIASVFHPAFTDNANSAPVLSVAPTRAVSSDIENSHVPDNITLDYSKSVGEIPIYSGTSQTGARTYEIPLQLSPGIAGHTPRLSLSYNSQAGNSALGMGWTIGGLSSIRREVKTMYYDNQAEGIKMDLTDAFSLDGMHLIKKNMESDVIFYESEIGDIQAKAHINNNVLSYFEVFYPDGHKGIFGRIGDTENRLEYPMMSFSDPAGNNITYNYTFYNNHYAIYRVAYNSIYTIFFSYDQTRPDSIQGYCSGLHIRDNRRLTNITCRCGSSVQRSYTLSYTIQNNHSLLTQVDYIEGTESLNPIRFYYGEGPVTAAYTASNTLLLGRYYPINDPKDYYTVQGKFEYTNNNEGLIVFPARDPYWKTSQNCIQNLYASNDTILIYRELDQGSTTSIDIKTAGDGFTDLFCADLTGDGYDCIVKVNNRVVNNKDQVEFRVYRPTMWGTLSLLYTRTFSFSTVFTSSGIQNIQPKYYSIGDFNGDGKLDILALSAFRPLSGDTRNSRCYLFDLPGNQLLYEGLCFPFTRFLRSAAHPNAQSALILSDRCIAMDYDGDGKTDFLHVGQTQTDVYTFDNTTNGLQLRKVTTYNNLRRTQLTGSYSICELNGDGLMDLLVAPSSGTNWNIYNSTGDGQFVHSNFAGPSMSADSYAIMRDVNHDGLTDVITVSPSSFTTYLTQGNSLGNPAVTTNFPTSNAILTTLNINSHNHSTLLLSLKNDIVTKYAFTQDDSKEAMITGMANSLGVIEKNQYCLLAEQNPNYTSSYISGYFPSFPYIATNDYAPVLQRTELFLNGARKTWDNFYYSQASYHLQGLGFRGFAQIARKNANGSFYRNKYAPEAFGVITKEESPEFVTNHTYSLNIQSNKITKLLRTGETRLDKLADFTSTTTYTYDSYGYPTSKSTVFPDGTSTQEATSYLHMTTVGDGYCMGLPTQKTHSNTKDGDAVTEQTIFQQYLNCKPQKITHLRNNNNVKEELITYNTQGLPLHQSQRTYSSTNILSTFYSYDSYGRVTQKTDPMGFVTCYAYDTLGRMTGQTDYRGGVTLYDYDSFGRETGVTLPDSTAKTTTYGWTTEVTNGCYSVTQTQTRKPTTKIVYDALNREVRRGDLRFDSVYRYVDRTYDDYGRLAQVSQPYKSLLPAFWNRYTYDSHHRITSYREGIERETTYSYDGLSTTTTENGIATTRTYDMAGNLTSVTDPAGTLTYSLSPDGQPLSITAPGNAVTTFTYDAYGRRTAINDPSAGTTTYEYDDEGNISSETNANGETIEYTYDQYGRLIEEVMPEFITTYTYNDLGELTAVTSDNGTSKEYTYDTHGRVTVEKESYNDDFLQKEFFYSSGQTDSIRYTSQAGYLTTEIYEYAHGHFTKGSLSGGREVYELQAESEQGRPATIYTGSLIRKYTYDSFGAPVRRQAARMILRPTSVYGAGPQSLFMQDFTYSFNATTGNLLSRTDGTRAITESFTYDNLNRLASYNGEAITYEDNGNIIEIEDAGWQEYDTQGKPYAVSGAGVFNKLSSSTAQSITYTSFKRPAGIIEGNSRSFFTYNADGERVQKTENYRQITWDSHYTNYFGECYESYSSPFLSGIYTERLYLFGNCYNAPAVLIKTNNTDSLFYILRDYQGSITHIVKENGSLRNEQSYDAWGRLRNPATHALYSYDEQPELFLGRGYTGHEHLPHHGLINMNARLYDPAVGRFLSPDPYVQAPDNAQSFNRYTYCLNNPLKYTDESGEFWWILISAGIGGVVNLGMKALNGQIHSWGDGFAAFGIGAVAGAVAGVAGYYAFGAVAGSFAAGAGGFWAGAVGGAASGITSAAFLGAGNHMYFHDPYPTWRDYAISGIGGAFIGGVANGSIAVLQGNNFWNGEAVAAGSNPFAFKNSQLDIDPSAQSKELNLPSSISTSPEIQENLSINTDNITGDNSYSVYYGYDTTDENIRYIGITKRSPQIRFAEHWRSSSPRANLYYDVFPGTGNLTRMQARILEQQYINKYGFGLNGQLYNLRNEIAPKWWLKYNIKP
ncbi:MAG: VCBS repeat-containing protein [Prevotella sp.]|nr:VCBS repeat-containing protein [Prevotella sp.]